jgi:hypothetical protein
VAVIWVATASRAKVATGAYRQNKVFRIRNVESYERLGSRAAKEAWLSCKVTATLWVRI